MSLCFGSRKPKLIGCTNAYMAGDINSRKSTYGFFYYIFKRSCIVAVKVTKVYCVVYHIGRILCNNKILQGTVMDETVLA